MLSARVPRTPRKGERRLVRMSEHPENVNAEWRKLYAAIAENDATALGQALCHHLHPRLITEGGHQLSRRPRPQGLNHQERSHPANQEPPCQGDGGADGADPWGTQPRASSQRRRVTPLPTKKGAPSPAYVEGTLQAKVANPIRGTASTCLACQKDEAPRLADA